jgi:hypothetical protein
VPKKIFRKGETMVKSMIYMDESTHTRLKHIAVDERVSMAELIRKAVDEYLGRHYSKKGGTKK